MMSGPLPAGRLARAEMSPAAGATAGKSVTDLRGDRDGN
jgi:hypothetical protein